MPYNASCDFDVSLVENIIIKMKRGKAAGLDCLTSEHLQFSHPAMYVVLAKLFNFMAVNGIVPDDFGRSYTVLLPKNMNNVICKCLNVDDFRGITISLVLSKVFEHCILDRYNGYFVTSDNQFGFKKGLGCSHAMYSVKCVVNHYTRLGSTINLCALDLKKAFDKMNHHGLFIKLMDRLLPANILCVLENWFSLCATRVHWGNEISESFKIECGIRQGGVLSPYLFAIYVDDIVTKLQRTNLGCYIKGTFVGIFFYADDIVLLAPSIESLQKLIYVCETELVWLDMTLNVKKSMCMRIGPRYDIECASLTTLSWVNCCRYLGVEFTASRHFKCSFSNAKKS